MSAVTRPPAREETGDVDGFFNAGKPVQRDSHKRPLIIPPEGGNPVSYTRVSTLASKLSDAYGLMTWNMRQVAQGFAEHEDLAAMFAALPPLTGDKKFDGPTNARRDEIIEMALDRVGAHAKANWGTAIHTFVEPGPHGEIPTRMVSDVESFHRAMRGTVQVLSEQFVVHDEFKVAGTFDELRWCPGYGLIVADTKTGVDKPLQVVVQLALYAGGQLYNKETGAREPWPAGFNPDWGLFTHTKRGKGVTDLYIADLRTGRQAAAHAAFVRDWNRADTEKNVCLPAPDFVDFAENLRGNALDLIQGATTRSELQGIHADFRYVWDGEVLAAAQKRWEELAVST